MSIFYKYRCQIFYLNEETIHKKKSRKNSCQATNSHSPRGNKAAELVIRGTEAFILVLWVCFKKEKQNKRIELRMGEARDKEKRMCSALLLLNIFTANKCFSGIAQWCHQAETVASKWLEDVCELGSQAKARGEIVQHLIPTLGEGTRKVTNRQYQRSWEIFLSIK